MLTAYNLANVLISGYISYTIIGCKLTQNERTHAHNFCIPCYATHAFSTHWAGRGFSTCSHAAPCWPGPRHLTHSIHGTDTAILHLQCPTGGGAWPGPRALPFLLAEIPGVLRHVLLHPPQELPPGPYVGVHPGLTGALSSSHNLSGCLAPSIDQITTRQTHSCVYGVQVSFLHIFHHASLTIVIGSLLPLHYGGDVYLPVLVNRCGTHIDLDASCQHPHE